MRERVAAEGVSRLAIGGKRVGGMARWLVSSLCTPVGGCRGSGRREGNGGKVPTGTVRDMVRGEGEITRVGPWCE